MIKGSKVYEIIGFKKIFYVAEIEDVEEIVEVEGLRNRRIQKNCQGRKIVDD